MPSLKLATARTLKWNTIDRLASQLIYAAVGIVLANVVSKEAFGIVGVMLVFQAFALIFVDGGFGAALLQKKETDSEDYSTVFWFNLSVSAAIYIVLWFAAPLISALFHHTEELIAMSRVMFLSFVFNGLGIVQGNRLMKQMDVRKLTVANLTGQVAGGVLGIVLALQGFEAWAIVWQSVSHSLIRGAMLWFGSSWRPRLIFSRKAFRHIFRMGMSVFSTSFLNTVCLNVYTFIIGVFYPLASLGVYTQADKWSKMGSASVSQVFTATFLPLMSRFQDSASDFNRVMGKTNRMAAFITLPCLGGLIVMGAPIFHVLFGNKWDAAIPLFQILAARGILVVFISLLGNYMLSLGRAGSIVRVEMVKDLTTIGAIFATLPFGTIEALVWGQGAASLVTLIYVTAVLLAATGYGFRRMLLDILPYLLTAALAAAVALLLSLWIQNALLLLLCQLTAGIAIYCAILHAFGSVTLAETYRYVFGRFMKKK